MKKHNYRHEQYYKDYVQYIQAENIIDTLFDDTLKSDCPQSTINKLNSCITTINMFNDVYVFRDIMKLPRKQKKQYKKDVCAMYNTPFIMQYLERARYVYIIKELKEFKQNK